MAQLTIDGSFSIDDKIEEAAKLFSPDGSIGTDQMLDFARFCRREGYLDDVPIDASVAVGDAHFIKDHIFKGVGTSGIRKWICTGEGNSGRWVSRRIANKTQRLSFLRLLKKKKNDAHRALQFELSLFNADFGEDLTEETIPTDE